MTLSEVIGVVIGGCIAFTIFGVWGDIAELVRAFREKRAGRR